MIASLSESATSSTKSGQRCLYSAILFQNMKNKLSGFEENLCVSHNCDNTSEKKQQRFMSVMNLFHFVNSGGNNRPQCLLTLSQFFFKCSSNHSIFRPPVLEKVFV